MTLLIFTQALVCSVILILLVNDVIRDGLVINVYWCAYYVFDLMFVLPELVTSLYGRLDISSRGYLLLTSDQMVDVIYLVFVLVCAAFFRILARKHRRSAVDLAGLREVGRDIAKVPSVICLVAFAGVLAMYFAAALSPQPELYYGSFAAFYRTDVYDVTSSALSWHEDVMQPCLRVSFVFAAVLWYVSETVEDRGTRIVLRAFLIVSAFALLLFSSKRTLGTLLFALYLVMDIVFRDRTPWGEIVAFAVFVGAFFFFYQEVTGKTTLGGVSSGVEIYIDYFGRSLDTKFVIYSLLHPEVVSILDYPGQSVLFDLLFFIPRSIWSDKPYPFGDYYTAAWFGNSIIGLGFRITTCWFAEMLANYSWIGLPIALLIYKAILDLFDKIEHPVVSLFSIYVACYLMVTHFGSNQENLIFLALLAIIFRPRRRPAGKAYVAPGGIGEIQ